MQKQVEYWWVSLAILGEIVALFCCKPVRDCSSKKLPTTSAQPQRKGILEDSNLSLLQRRLPAYWTVFLQILDSWQGGF